jgi:hypothetical protein
MFPEASLNTVTYHALVLTDCGCVLIADVQQARGALIRSFVSNVADNPQFVAILRATEQLDEGR